MTQQEQQMLQGLVDRVNRSQLQEKDPDAERFIQQTLGPNPDATYIMAQTILVQQYALDQAQRQLADLRAQLAARPPVQEARHASSFLGNLLGRHDEAPRQAPPPPPPPPPPAYPPQQAPGQAQYGSGYGYGPGYAPPPPGYPPMEPPQSGGFLRSAMQTATGVAAGALAFEGIESLMHGFGHAAGYGTELVGPGFGGGAGRPEEVINNYYGDSSQQERDLGGHEGFTDSAQSGSASEIGDSAKLQDTSYGTDKNLDDSSANADDLSGTTGTDYSANDDDSMLSDDVSDQDSGNDFDSGGDDSGGFDGGDDGGGDFGGGDDGGGF